MFTYGYVQRRDFSVYAVAGATSDIELDLLRGVNITLTIPFMDEGILKPTQFNMSMRVRVFDQDGNLVGTASSKGPDNGNLRTDFGSSSFFGLGRFTGNNIDPIISISESYYADPFTASPAPGPNPQNTDSLLSIGGEKSAETFLWYGTWPVGLGGSRITGWQAFDSDPDHDGVSNFGTFQSNVNFWGLEEWKTSIPYNTEQVRVFLAGIYDPFGDPLDGFNSAALHTCSWKTSRGEAIDSMYYGILGSSTDGGYTGPWFVEVDCWNEYPKSEKGPGIAPPTTNWYPPVEGLLEGDSFHLIPGTSGDEFGFVNDTLSANGFGPYAQSQAWSLPNAALGMEVSGIYALDKRGYISGLIEGFNYFDQLDPESWFAIQASSATPNMTFTQWSWDGHYEMYLPSGQYSMQVFPWASQGNVAYNATSSVIEISPGESLTGIDFTVERSGIPLQEFNSNLVFTVLAFATVTVGRRGRKSGLRRRENERS